jgi:asparagine synthetase B (glutamine-hydrolysing)
VRSLTPLEVAVGFVLAPAEPAPLPEDGGPADPLAALEAAIVPSLLRPPCLVSFSGGRDSSAVLAAATRAARRHGLDDPIPATIRAPAARAADESAWQETAVRHLGIADWLRLDFGDELDAVGPIARAALLRHGLLWPFNAHFHVPLLEAARGGSLLTGVGGDELFAAAMSPRAAAVLSARVRPTVRDMRRIALYAAPRPLRRGWHRRRELPLPWLTAAGRDAASRAVAGLEAAEPRRLASRLAWLRGATALSHGTASLAALAGDAGAAIAHPLLDHHLWSAVARTAPRGGYLARTDAMRALFAEVLPDAVLARSDKATFDELFFAAHSRALAAEWSGEGVPPALVDADALRAHWQGPSPHAHSFTLLQAAFLGSSAERVEQPRGGLREHVPAAGAPETPHGQ